MNTQNAASSVRDLSEMLYGVNTTSSQFNTLLTNGGFMNLSGVENLSFYELSYNWFVKRFYEFNTLSTNQVEVYPVLRRDNKVVANVSSFEAASSGLSFDLSVSSFGVATSLDFTGNARSSHPLSATTTGSDLYLNYYDKTFLTKNRLELIQNIVRNKSTTSVPFYKFSYSHGTSYPRY